jgi:hypothetical protein
MGKLSTASDGHEPSTRSQLPAIGQSPAKFGEFEFETGPKAPDRPGVFILARHEEGLVKPVYVGEGESIVNAIASVRSANAGLDATARDAAWLASPFTAERARIVRDLIGLFTPEFNAEGRSEVRPASPVITMPVVKLPNLPATADLVTTFAGRKPTLESEIAQLVARF